MRTSPYAEEIRPYIRETRPHVEQKSPYVVGKGPYAGEERPLHVYGYGVPYSTVLAVLETRQARS